MTNQPRRVAILVGLLAGLTLACQQERVAAPSTQTIRVSVNTSGLDQDPDGYDIVIDTARRRVAPGKATATISVSEGEHTVAIEDVAANCAVNGSGKRPTRVGAGENAVVSFAVSCDATGVDVRTHTVGPGTPIAYDVVVDGRVASAVAPNGSVVLSRFTPGAHTVALALHNDNCTIQGSVSVALTVEVGRVTTVPFEIACVAVARTGTIAYTADTIVAGNPVHWIMLMNTDGSGSVALREGTRVTWSPDGSRIAFGDLHCKDFDTYYGYPCAGGIALLDPGSLAITALPNGDSGFNPSWSAASNEVVFTRCCAFQDRPRLIVVDAASGKMETLPMSSLDAVFEPAFSPTARQIVFGCQVPRQNDTDICVVNRDGTGFQRLTTDGASDYNPAWSADGTRLAFSRMAKSGRPLEIVIMNSDGTGLRSLTTGYEATWLRDGRLLFAGGDGLYLINADGTGRTRLTTGDHHAPAWRP